MFMICQYSAGLTALSLAKSTTLLGNPRIVNLVASLKVVYAKFAEFRLTMRLFGLLPILQWADNLSKQTDPPSGYINLLEKLQVLSLLIYYPFEHAYYFGSRGMITSMKPSTLRNAALISCSFWASYTVFKLMQIVEEMRLLKVQKSKAVGISQISALNTKERNTRESLIVNTAYFPMTLHWFVLFFCSKKCLRLVTGHFQMDFYQMKS